VGGFLRWSERSELSSGAAFPNAFSYACAKPATELLRAGTTLPFDDRMVKFKTAQGTGRPADDSRVRGARLSDNAARIGVPGFIGKGNDLF